MAGFGAKEQLFGGNLRGPLRARVASLETNPFFDRTLVQSGSTTVTVSTALVSSESAFFIAEEAGSVTSGGGRIAVSSIVDGTSFALARVPVTAAAADAYVTWQLINPKSS